MLTAEELLAGSALTFEVEVPAERPAAGERLARRGSRRRPRAAARRSRSPTCSSSSARPRRATRSLGTLMVQRALVEPALSVAEVAALHVGLVQFLLQEVNRISGIDATSDELAEVEERRSRRRRSSWRASSAGRREQISELTLGQVLLHLQMLDER